MSDNHSSISIRKRTHTVLFTTRAGKLGRFISRTIIILILINALALMLETVDTLYSRFNIAFSALEITSLIVFSIEYLARLWSCVEDDRYTRPIAGRIRYSLTPLALIDAAAILPGLLPFLDIDLRSLRLLRLMRLARLAKLGRYSNSIRAMGNVLTATWRDLTVVTVGLVLLLCVSATLMYYAESDVQPDEFSSIPQTLWWAVATLTTIGYGDVYPITALGKLLSSLLALLGIGFVALPTGILSAAYLDEIRKLRSQS